MIEREVKLQFPGVDEARTAVIAAGARPLRPRRLQDDVLFDTPDQSLRGRGCAVRLRTEYSPAEAGHDDGAERVLLTYKGPVRPGTMKTREELETAVADRHTLLGIFEALDLRPCFRYQKYREEFAAPEATIAIDETPIGTFVEIEGSEAAILEMTQALDRTPGDFILASYYRLFMTRRDQIGLAGTDMVFAAG